MALGYRRNSCHTLTFAFEEQAVQMLIDRHSTISVYENLGITNTNLPLEN